MKTRYWILIAGVLALIGAGLFYTLSDSESPGNLVLNGFVSDQALEQPVITINQNPIRLGLLLEEVRKKGAHLPGRFDRDEQRQQVIDELIHFELLAQEAKKLNYHNDPEIRLAYKKLLVAKFKREQIQTKLSDIVITQEQVNDYYQDHIDAYKEPAMRRVAMIFLRKPAGQTNVETKRQQQQIARIRQMAMRQTVPDFGKLAAQYSDDLPTKYKGGALPWLAETSRNFRLEPALVNAAFKLDQKGDISRPLTTKHGLYLLKLIALRPEKTKSLAAVRLQIRADLKASLKQNWLDQFHKKLKATAEIQTNDQLLSENAIWRSQRTSTNQVPTFPAKR